MTLEPKRRVLGKGLSSLIPEAPALSARDPLHAASPNEPTAPTEIPIDRVQPNPQQPRQQFRAEEIDELAASIKQSGILQPLLVRPAAKGSYTLVAGERRLRAARKAGLTHVPVIVRDVPDARLLEFALVENLQRDDLGPMETARAFRELIRTTGLTQAEAAERVGKPRSSVANTLRLLDLPEPVQQLLSEGKLDMGHGRALAGLDGRDEQIALARRAAARGLSVREVEQRVRRLNSSAGSSTREAVRPDPNVAAAEKTLARALEARVAIHVQRQGQGRIEIQFADAEDLQRLYQRLMRAAGQKPQA